MTPARIAMLERNLNPTMRKVLDAVPIQEAWTAHQIGGELSRTGKRLEVAMIIGCLNALKREGLAKEPQLGVFMRVAAQPRVHLVPQPTQEPDVALPEPKAAPDPFADLDALSTKLVELSVEAEKIADAMRARLAEVEKKMEKFKQFQELLKGMA